MLIRLPLGKLWQVIPNRLVVSMEKVRTIAMDQYPMLVMLVEAVASDVVALFQHQHLPAELAGHSLSHDDTG